jgi:hypothetical protein
LIILKGKIEISKFETVSRTYIEVVDRAIEGDPLCKMMLEGSDEEKTESKTTSLSSGSANGASQREATKRSQASERKQREQQEDMWREQKLILEDLLGGGDSIRGQVIPCSAPEVFTMNIGIRLSNGWILEQLGDWSGIYTVIAQVDESIPTGSKWQTVRVFRKMPITKIEEKLLDEAMRGFTEPIKSFFDMDSNEDLTAIEGPLITLRPVAIYR